MRTLTQRLTEQNAIASWRWCDDAGLRHQWERRDVSQECTPDTRARAENEGWYVCRRAACPAARFGGGS